MHIRGAYIGLDLKHGKPELIRPAMEGIAMNFCACDWTCCGNIPTWKMISYS